MRMTWPDEHCVGSAAGSPTKSQAVLPILDYGGADFDDRFNMPRRYVFVENVGASVDATGSGVTGGVTFAVGW